jgi:hypothetical protein
MLSFLTGFLSLSGGAIFAQAVYFLFVKYPAELSRLDIDIEESDSRFGWEMGEEDLALNLLKDFAEGHFLLFKDWANLEDPEVRQKHKVRLTKDIWRVKTIDGAGNLALSRAAHISSEALAGIYGILSDARVLTGDDLHIVRAQSDSVLESFGAALRLGRVLNNSRKAEVRRQRNESADLKFLRGCARFGILTYGLIVAEIAAYKLRHLAIPHASFAVPAFLSILSLTLLMLMASFIRERSVERAKSQSGKGNDA